MATFQCKKSQSTQRALALKCGHCLVRQVVWRGAGCEIVKNRCLGVCLAFISSTRGCRSNGKNIVCALTFIFASCAIVCDMTTHLHVHCQNEDSGCWMPDIYRGSSDRFQCNFTQDLSISSARVCQTIYLMV